VANVFAIRFSEWQSLWRMHRIRQTKATTGENKIKTVLCNIDTRSPFAAPTSRGLPRTASAPHK